MCRISVHLILFLSLFQSCQLSHNIAYNIPDPDCTGVFFLCTDADKDRLGRHAVKTIHEQMDDDKDGMIEASESNDFIKEELESKTDSVRHRNFQNADLQITFKDLWVQWEHSVVYNWTTENVVDWLINHVHLPMYVDNIRRNQIDGRMIPRLAANEKHYLSAIMHIRDPRHKRRLIIKATDVVLFGAPQNPHNVIKDIILISALLIAVGACLYAFIRHRKTEESMKTMLKELESLQKADGDLTAVTGKIKAMEFELKEKTKVDRGLLNTWYSEVQRTKDEAEKYRKRRDSTIDHDKQLRLAVQELEQLRIALRKAEEHAQHQSYEAPSELIDLLRRTYFIEEMAFEVKRKAAENVMLTAKEQMNKISKMQRGFLGAVRIAHTGCIDDISELINSAKERLADIQDEYEERERRWNRISSLLDREDLISNSSTSTTSMVTNQYVPGSTNTSLNNGINNSISAASRVRDSNNRPKHSDSNGDLLSINKSNSNTNCRGSSMNLLSPTQNSQQDTISQCDNASLYQDSASVTLKRRTMTNSSLLNNLSSPDRLTNTPKMVHSHSSHNLNGPTGITRQATYDSIDSQPSVRHTKAIFDIVPNVRLDDNDFLLNDNDQQFDRKSQISDAGYDDQRSVSSSEKSRKHTLSSKLLKPFQNMRMRKKSNGGT